MMLGQAAAATFEETTTCTVSRPADLSPGLQLDLASAMVSAVVGLYQHTATLIPAELCE